MTLADRYDSVMSRIDDACDRNGRTRDELTIIVVTKYQPASMTRQLAALGVTDVGENRHQDAAPKAAELDDLDLTWHFVGQLQSNKAKAVSRYVSAVHSVDRPSLVTALGRVESALDVFLEVNLTDNVDRGGVEPRNLGALAEAVLATSSLRLRGVMAVAPLEEEPRRAFARLRDLSAEVRSIAPEATAISAGMSGDFAEAIAEGATHLRIGSAITGNRPTAA